MSTKPSKFDVLTTTATELHLLLESGTISSVDIVELYLSQIERHNHAGLGLNAIISVAPKRLLLQRAQELDQERATGRTRGPLHGLPIIVKVELAAILAIRI